MRMVIAALGFINPLIQGYLISFMASQGTAEAEQVWKGLTVCVVVLAASLFQAVVAGMCRYLEYKAYVRIYSSLLISIYKKSLTMNGTTKQDTTTGEIVNLMSIDTRRTTALIYEVYVYFYVPVQSAIALYMLYQLLGNAAFAGLGIIAISAPATLLIASITQRLRKIAMEVKDQRIKLMNETLNAIKIIKLYAWEPAFQTKICELRKKEIHTEMKLSMLGCVFHVIYAIIPILVTIVVFSIYTATTPDHILTPSVAFVSLSLINILRDGLNHVPHSIAFIVECLVSYRRIVNFFKTEDIDESNVNTDQSASNPIEVVAASFSHLPDKPKVLHDINLTIREGSLTAIVGAVGAGKSSLLAALVGDLYKHQGTVTVKGSVALVAQQAFILNDSVRDNILFGSEYKADRYNEVVEACALTKDFEVLANGDQTTIGEKGINLSGGQKQRISLARAVYNDADIYLLDDPLSAVDAHVGRHIFDHVIGPNGLLRQKTRFMVTHGIHWLPLVQEVYVLKSGRIGEHGTYKSLLGQGGDFSEFLKTYFLNEENEGNLAEGKETAEDDESESLPKIMLERLESITSTGSNEEVFNELLNSTHPTSNTPSHSSKKDATSTKSQADSQLARLLSKEEEEMEEKPDDKSNNIFDEEEEVGRGTVSWRVYFAYLQAIGWKRITPLSVLIVLATGAPVFSSIWLSEWTGDPIFLNTTVSNDTKESYMQMYLTVFSLSGVVGALLILTYIIGSAYCFYIASGNLHNRLLNRILKAKMAFFDTKPLGMILNRFSKDVDTMDDEVGWSLMSTVDTSIEIIASLAGIIYATNIMVVPIVIIAACYYLLQRYFLSTARQTRRLKSKAASPIYSHFSETLAGSQTIRAYKQQERFVETNVKHVEEFNIYTYFERFVDGWLDVRMKCMGGLMTFATSLFCVLSTQIPFLQNLVTPSIAGLVLSLTFSVTGSLKGFVWIMVWAETSIVAVERILEYSEVEQEAAWDCSEPPPSEWPTSGSVKFINYATRYRPELDLVINGLSIEVKPREKVGIVGRTGAGKSSLTLSLFRLIEAAQGNITIDGVNIADVGLHDLRNNITILPQDPILFSGSVRENLDPFTKCSDERLWQVLEQCQLKEFVSEQPEQLSADCGEGGQNLSVGQRQLICLARALLRKTRILVMDEATAAVDLKTDDFIQKTIRSQFSDCTILTIAHRLNTIIDSDRVLVMDQGNVAEFGAPQDLLANEKSVFHGMAKEAGIL
ncbi:ATP-binding cassette sub-family C member 2-like [Watersipora subatra]|uniref:ATP-binding cassette sub-family C member 2-like n=1 Tax=Watersipora subatra TaxID=2589382 RepID=UPI00355C39EE